MCNFGYCDICEGDMGYVEVVNVMFDLVCIGYCEIFEIFFVMYDLIMLNW